MKLNADVLSECLPPRAIIDEICNPGFHPPWRRHSSVTKWPIYSPLRVQEDCKACKGRDAGLSTD